MLFSPKISMDDKIRKAREETEKKIGLVFFRPATFTFEELARTEKKWNITKTGGLGIR